MEWEDCLATNAGDAKRVLVLLEQAFGWVLTALVTPNSGLRQ